MPEEQTQLIKYDIAHQFGLWTARSAMRGWGQQNVSQALGTVDFKALFYPKDEIVGADEFRRWHDEEIRKLKRLEFKTDQGKRIALEGAWAAKMLAIYLKTTCYLAGFGRPGLSQVIHPPIDRNLVRNLKREFATCPEILRGLPAFKPSNGGIGGMSEADYDSCIASCRLVAEKLGCKLIEVEQFWTPT